MGNKKNQCAYSKFNKLDETLLTTCICKHIFCNAIDIIILDL